MRKITNNFNLPQALVNMAVEGERENKPKHFSVTTLLNPVLMTMLSRKYDVEVDVSSMIWMLFGTAVHSILEKHGEVGLSEIKMKLPLKNGGMFTGIMDFYNEKEFAIEDFKTATVWKVVNQDFADNRKQVLMYAWLARKTKQLHVAKGRLYYLLKDWTPMGLYRDKDYPLQPVYTYEFDISESDFAEIETYIANRLNLFAYYEDKPINEIPICTPEERWNTGDKFAVMKKGRKSALRLLDTKEEAENYLLTNGGDFIEERKGEDKRCENYCDYKNVCPYYTKKEVK